MLTGGPAEVPTRQRVPPRRPAIANSRAMASLAKSCPSRSACSLRNEASTTRPASGKYSTASASAYSSSTAAAWPNQGSALPQSTAVGQRAGCCQQTAFVTCPRRGSEPFRRSSRCPSAAVISAVCLIACGVARAGVRTSHCDLRWRNKNACHPDVLAAQRRERSRIRIEKHIRWGGRPLRLAA